MKANAKIPANKMLPGDIFHPGEFIMDELEARGMKQIELAQAIGLSKSEISLILHGKRGITIPIALKLEQVLKVDATIWLGLQMKFDIGKLKKRYISGLKGNDLPDQKKKELEEVIAAA